MIVSGTDQLPSLGQNSKHEVHEAEGYRDFRNNPVKATGARAPMVEQFGLGFIPIPDHTLEALDHADLTLEGEILQREGAPFRYGVSRKLNVQEQDGVWVNVPGGRLWQMEVRSIGAENLMLKIENMNLPEGAEIRSYVPGLSETINGPYTGEGPCREGTQSVWTRIEAVDNVVIEYFEPETVAGIPGLPFTLGEVIHGYIPILKEGLAGGSGSCHNEATCYADWEDVGDATALVVFSGSLCSGQLIATSNQDQTAYYLTAAHCISSSNVASGAQFIFKYERLNCSGSTYQGIAANGSALIDTHGQSDNTLLRINGSLPSSIFWVGWTTDIASTNLPITCLHHPAGDRMKYSTGNINSNPVCGSSTYWFGVRWNDGVTEGGSSGSGAYRTSDQKLMGVLTCGASSCSNTNGLDGYGRFQRAYSTGGFAQHLELGPPGDDLYEENDSCSNAVFLSSGAGSYDDLIVKAKDEDWYRVNVPSGQTINFDLQFADANGDIDIELFSLSCSGDLVDEGDSNTNNESAQWSNFEATSKRIFARVFMYDGSENDYDMDISFENNPEPQGTCCVSTSCFTDSQANCLAGGGTWGGAGTACNAGSCVEATGACCVGSECLTLSGTICGLAQGSYNGDGSTECSDCGGEEPCTADTDGDGVVGGTDLAYVLAGWGNSGGDVTDDGVTDGEDLATVLAFWGNCE
ncbi:MAG: hypothetical protein CBC35_07415 [Planctomycetes bacterium TMED75]|nr:hypothetical protein [Planctomycetaceae bacterium]OUU92325.1 MAG: hypothetical protein CBC35_07415 [Planctomycetes bacterium TMED75]